MFAATTLLYYQLDKYEEFGIEGPLETYADLIDIASKVNTPEVPAIALRGAPQAPAGNVGRSTHSSTARAQSTSTISRTI